MSQPEIVKYTTISYLKNILLTGKLMQAEVDNVVNSIPEETSPARLVEITVILGRISGNILEHKDLEKFSIYIFSRATDEQIAALSSAKDDILGKQKELFEQLLHSALTQPLVVNTQISGTLAYKAIADHMNVTI